MSQVSWSMDLPVDHPTHLPQVNHRLGSFILLRHSIANLIICGSVGPKAFLSDIYSILALIEWYRNINLLSIGYVSRPRLRSRLTLGGRTFPRNPWTFGGRDSHSSFATHANILTCMVSTTNSRCCFIAHTTLSYPSYFLDRNLD